MLKVGATRLNNADEALMECAEEVARAHAAPREEHDENDDDDQRRPLEGVKTRMSQQGIFTSCSRASLGV